MIFSSSRRLGREFLVVLLILIIGGFVSVASAQTALQPIYTRQSKGAAIPLWPNATGTTTAISISDAMAPSSSGSSSIMNWGGFSSASIVVNYSNATCGGVVIVSVSGGVSAAAATFAMADPVSNGYFAWRSQSYSFDVNYPYIKVSYNALRVTAAPPSFPTYVDAVAGATSCTVTISIIPMPSAVGVPASGNLMLQGDATADALTTADLIVSAALFRNREVILQNQGIVPVKCGLVSNTFTSGFILSAGTVAEDGTGGSVTLHRFNGPVWCKTTASSAVVHYTAW